MYSISKILARLGNSVEYDVKVLTRNAVSH